MSTYKFDVWFENGENRQFSFFADDRDDAWKQFNSLDLACVTDVYMSFDAPVTHGSKFHHCFVYDWTVYGSPYSDAGIDFMDGAEAICSTYRLNERTARILSEMCLYWGILTHEIATDESESFDGYTVYAIKRFYSLAYRIEKLWGEYAARAIFNTCGFEF